MPMLLRAPKERKRVLLRTPAAPTAAKPEVQHLVIRLAVARGAVGFDVVDFEALAQRFAAHVAEEVVL